MDLERMDLESMIRHRHLELWAKVLQAYDVSPEINARVRAWIQNGTFAKMAHR
jgi:hypothetical protein